MVSKASAGPVRAGSERALRIGVIGAGVMGSNHGRVLAGLPGVELVGIVDPLPAHRARAAELIGCPTFTEFDELVAAGVDAVTIAAPTHLHHELALACIAREIHVLVEKPIASTVEEGCDIVDAAHRGVDDHRRLRTAVKLTNRGERNPLTRKITGQFDETMNVPCAETLR